MKSEDVYAVIIGISQYQDKSISTLKYTDEDAHALYNLLLDTNRCGVPEKNMKLLLSNDATAFNIKDSVSGWLRATATKDSTAVIYFAGHGGSEPSPIDNEKTDKYLLPWDTKLTNLYASAISCLAFNDLLNRINVKRKVIFMDACYSGGLAKQGARDLNIIDNLYDTIGKGEGTILIAASQPNQRSWEYEKIGHGIFTYHLLEALNGAADADKNGEVTVWEVIDYLKRKVPESAKRYVNEDQTPYWSGEGSGDIKLTVDAKIIEELRLNQDKVYQEKRKKLLDFYGKIPQKDLDSALELLKKPVESLTEIEDDILKFINLLINGEIPPQKYLNFYRMINPTEAEKKIEKPSEPVVKTNPISRESLKPNVKFCINCGKKIYPGNKFCIGCGNKI